MKDWKWAEVSQGPSLYYWRPSFPDLGRFAEAVRRKLFR